MDIDPIIISDAGGQEIGRIERKRMKRFSMQAASDHRKMDEFAARDARAATATIGELRFHFEHGRSRSDFKL